MLRLFEPRFGVVYVLNLHFDTQSFFSHLVMKVKRTRVYPKNLTNVFVFDENTNENLKPLLVKSNSIINLSHVKNSNNKWKRMRFENAKSKIFKPNCLCKKENIEKCRKPNNCFVVLFFQLDKKTIYIRINITVFVMLCF